MEDSSSSQEASPYKASEADYAHNSTWLLHKASKADVQAQEHRFFLQGVNLPSYCFIFFPLLERCFDLQSRKSHHLLLKGTVLGSGGFTKLLPTSSCSLPGISMPVWRLVEH